MISDSRFGAMLSWGEKPVARQVPEKDITATLAAAQQWIETCLVHDRSLFSQASLWTASLVNDLSKAFVDHPDLSKHDFMTKLKGQMRTASPLAQQLMAEMLWTLLLFPSNIKASTKQRQICEMWELSRHKMQDNLALLSNEVLAGIGSGGPGFNNYRPAEMAYLLAVTGDLKRREEAQRRRDARLTPSGSPAFNGKREL